ncbi:hypothetical protein ACFXDA_03655, partial [Streptomyces sp. NPDC059389]
MTTGSRSGGGAARGRGEDRDEDRWPRGRGTGEGYEMKAVDRQLLDAARAGDAAAVRAAVEGGANVEARDTELRTPLLLASLGNHVEAAGVLVAAGADADAQDAREDSAWLVTGVTGSVAM